jgi:hypothetical protein
VQVVAFDEVQLKVVALPAVTVAGFSESAIAGLEFELTLTPEQPTIAHEAARIPNKNTFDIMYATTLGGNAITKLAAKTRRVPRLCRVDQSIE